VSDIDTVVVDSLKALDPERPITEADMNEPCRHVAFVPKEPTLAGLFDHLVGTEEKSLR
jgi:hypothetical protein